MADAREVIAEAVDAFNAHDEQRLRAGYADDVVMEAPGDVRLEGPAAVTEYAMTWLRAFSDARLTVHREVASGDVVVTEFTFSGTHDAPLLTPEGEIPPTGRTVNGRGVEVWRVRDGKIAEEHLYFDQMQVLTQLGLVPEPAAST